MSPWDYFLNGMQFGLGLAAGLAAFFVLVWVLLAVTTRNKRGLYYGPHTMEKCPHGGIKGRCLLCKFEI